MVERQKGQKQFSQNRVLRSKEPCLNLHQPGGLEFGSEDVEDPDDAVKSGCDQDSIVKSGGRSFLFSKETFSTSVLRRELTSVKTNHLISMTIATDCNQ